MLIDTHAHLNFKAFRKDLDNTLWKAREAGVGRIIVPGADLETSKRAVELARSYETIYAAVGIHPHHAKEIKKLETEKLKENLKRLAKNNKVVAIGECGLDYYQYKKSKDRDYLESDGLKVDKNLKKIQKEIFKIHLELAQALKLPVIFHCREAQEDMKKSLKGLKFKGLKGVFHCFSGDEKFLKWVLKKGFSVGFDGNITYNEKWQKIIKKTPLRKILLETDAPLLIPEPLKSQKKFPNKPENIKVIAEFIAKIKGDSLLRVARQTTKNAKELFQLV